MSAHRPAARAEWVERRKKLFGFEPDPAYTLAPFHPEAVNGMIAQVIWDEDGSLTCGLIPTWTEPPGRPIAAGERFNAVAKYLQDIGASAGLPALSFSRDGASLHVHASEDAV